VEATVVGIGRDNSDKGANKALTQAFKYALIQVLCIADAKDDGDGSTHEADAAPAPSPDHAAKERIDTLRGRIDACTEPELVKEWVRDQGFPWPWTDEACSAIEVELLRLDGEEF
jgi:hypothetical protein